jgi:uncharacterized protein YuzE
MKKSKLNYLAILLTMGFLVSNQFVLAQDAKPRKSPKASVMQRIGADTDIIIDYSRPAVNGRTIWGDLVPYGMNPGNKYSKDKPYPWRAGANENTTITISKDVKINGKDLPAGKYGIHMLPGKSEFKVMFNKVNDAWGSFSYDASQDALTITVKPASAEHTEWLEYSFEHLSASEATAYLKWEELKIPFKIHL